MNLLQFIEYKTSLTKSSFEYNGELTTTHYTRYTFIYIDKNGQEYSELYVNIEASITDPVIIQNKIKGYTRNISLDEYEDMLYNQFIVNAK